MSSAKKNIFQTKSKSKKELQIKLKYKSQKQKVNVVEGNELLVLISLIDSARNLNLIYSVYSVTPKTISQKCGLKPLEVIKHLQSLHTKKVISVIKNPENTRNNRLNQNQYNRDNENDKDNQNDKKNVKNSRIEFNSDPFQPYGIELNFKSPVFINRRFLVLIFNNQSTKRSKYEYIQ